MERLTVVAVKGVVEHGGRYLTIKRGDDDEIGSGIWEFPGGKVEFGESLEDALAREVLEETGLTVSVGKLLYATTFLTNPARQVFLIAYACSAKTDAVALSSEHSEYLWTDKNGLRERLDKDIRSDMIRFGIFELLA